MFAEESGGMFLFFIGLIIVFAILFNGGGSFLGGGSNNCAEQDNYNNLLSAITQTTANTNGKIETLANNLGASAMATVQNDDRNTRDLLNSIANVQKSQTDIYVSGIISENQKLNSKVQALETQIYMDGKFSAQDLQNCAIKNQLTTIQDRMLTAPPFIPVGGVQEIACANFPRRGGCNCND